MERGFSGIGISFAFLAQASLHNEYQNRFLVILSKINWLINQNKRTVNKKRHHTVQ